jgi:competence protein ComEA
MNLRFPIALAIVAAAAGAAAFRVGQSAPPAPVFSPGLSAPSGEPAPGRRLRASRAGIVVYVAGEVIHRGIYSLPPGARAVDALRAAGGPAPGADLVAVNLAGELSDGDEVAVPSLADTSEPPRTSGRRAVHHKKHRKHGRKRRHRRSASALGFSNATSDTPAETSPGDTSDAPTSLIDLNTADELELETLPGVGATLAQRIVAFRELTGPFATADDLLDVAGVTQTKLDEIEPYVETGAACNC